MTQSLKVAIFEVLGVPWIACLIKISKLCYQLETTANRKSVKNMKLLFLPYMAIYYSFLPIPQNVSKFYNGRCPVLCDLSAGHDRSSVSARPLSAELNTTHCLWSDVTRTSVIHAWEGGVDN